MKIVLSASASYSSGYILQSFLKMVPGCAWCHVEIRWGDSGFKLSWTVGGNVWLRGFLARRLVWGKEQVEPAVKEEDAERLGKHAGTNLLWAARPVLHLVHRWTLLNPMFLSLSADWVEVHRYWRSMRKVCNKSMCLFGFCDRICDSPNEFVIFAYYTP